MSAGLVVRAVGDRAVVADLPAALVPHLALAVRAAASTGVQDVVPGARSVLIRTARGTDLAALARAVQHLHRDLVVPQGEQDDADAVTIGVQYDGPDLDDVVAATGLTRDEVVRLHCQGPWTVAFMGFAPGFGYLTGGDPRLAVPRRDHPRRAVSAGSVALAGEFSGVYPRESPGGWQLIGHTTEMLWDVQRDPPALLRPGTRVHFQEQR